MTTDLELIDSTDGTVWANEFTNRFGDFWKQNAEMTSLGRHDDLEGLMQGWFANAIETGKRAGGQNVSDGIRKLVEQSGTNSRDHGFHDDEPVRADFAEGERGDKAHKTAFRNWIIAKLALMHEELSEMLGELRSGREVDEVYYVSKGNEGIEFSRQAHDENGVPAYKPEGFGIELADLVIRAADLAFLTNLPLDELVAIKHSYNKTRPYKHGRTL